MGVDMVGDVYEKLFLFIMETFLILVILIAQMEEIEYEDRAAKEATEILLQKEFPQVPKRFPIPSKWDAGYGIYVYCIEC